ncbi:MAG: ribosome silencing factor [Gammaproteobacteria bacterium]|nr:ribosome silencing factor [Gammaproteobacteria bacterium]
MQRNRLQSLVVHTLDEMKAQDITVLDVHGVSDVTDVMVIASGSSNRQVKAMAAAVVEKAKEHKYRPLGMEGEQAGEWVLVDLGDVVVHLMLPQVRDFYNLEKLWGDAVHGSTNVARGRKPGATVAQAHRAESAATADKNPARKVVKKSATKTGKKAAAAMGPAEKKKSATSSKKTIKPKPAKPVAHKLAIAKRSRKIGE